MRRVRAKSVFLSAVALLFALALAVAGGAPAATVNAGVPSRDASTGAPVGKSSASDTSTEESTQSSHQTNRTDGDSVSQDAESKHESNSNTQSTDQDSSGTNVTRTGRDRDCRDFASHEAAQRFFDRHGGSSTNNFDDLDRDHDGKACEDLPSESAPVGGIDTGGGGTAPTADAASSSPLPFVLGGAGAGLLLVLLGSSLRRRQSI